MAVIMPKIMTTKKRAPTYAKNLRIVGKTVWCG